MKKQPTIEQLETTNRAYDLRKVIDTDEDLAELFGISKMTMYSRFRQSNWLKQEMYFIDNIHSFWFENKPVDKLPTDY